MARYVYDCVSCGAETTATHAMGTAPIAVPCVPCRGIATRSFDIQFNQDTRRFRSGISQATGQPYAQSRGEERRIEHETGIAFVGRNDLTPREKQLGAYAKHVREGGERVASDVINPPEPVARKSVQDVLREKKVSLRP